MTRKSRAEMMEETRLKLIATAREHFGTVGYAQTVMDELTAKAGLTRGALYHHFGDKKGLFCAVLAQLDSELDARLADISASAPDAWSAFTGRCHAYLKMAIEPEVQRILLRDASSVLDADELQSIRLHCVTSIADMLRRLMDAGTIKSSSPEMLARLINGGLMDTALWIAKSEDDEQALSQALNSLDVLLHGLKI
ncbi:TetR/AcrR family transcriptional regulator [Photobacterium sp. WH77]|uniref:TetR/AcrR family transcriptional regulator n=1 Tax=Photobacterium TaxID=657 RepID=UPI001C442F42|nr:MULTISPECIES: TetR/AcrR family transcriptional regulator [Photobacterium]MBV7264242.1 TetR/AcrR family transcriptional regulator [Photobacterium sp. WH24]MCG2838144.1 TetR/AcrR family transcriptional regulator [Photobacterium sp. WH77]MCG2845762.1 TetR/AcrR family transcriptional regulator [Photobacterium sp. WH80]MDO6581525.1 TetR/AcrR family transcriptional regulator [Photobacterium sp. 2_MG-2023]